MLQVLATAGTPLTPAELAQQFKYGKAEKIEDILEALALLGQARQLRGGNYGA